MTTLGSLAVEINATLGARQDVMTYTTYPTIGNLADTDRLAIWLKDAYTEICLGYRFEELCQEFDDVLAPGIDVVKLPPACRFLRSLTLMIPNANGNDPRPVRRRHIRNLRRYQTSRPGPPAIYAPFNPGGQPSILIRPVPDQAYPFIWDIQIKPTFAASIATTVIQLPDDWIGVLKASVQLKGHAALGENDKAQAMQIYLFGGYDPGLGRRVPGFIKQLTAPRDQLDIEDTEYGLQPMIRRYTNSV